MLNTSSVVVAVDAMSGDVGLDTTLNATKIALQEYPDLHCILVGDQKLIKDHATFSKLSKSRIEIAHCTQIVAMDESPQAVLRHKNDSSMWKAIELVRDGKAKACISAGNTGALMASARYILKMLPGISRPAICTTVPSIGGHCHWLDLGANIDSKPEQLMQFAIMGSEVAKAVNNNQNPRVGLLNVGTEAIKGSETIKEASKLIEQSDLNYIGFVEGSDIFLNDQLDVVVCDGLVGNIALKSIEGLAKYIRTGVKEAFMRNWMTKISALFSFPILKQLKTLDTRRYNGASLLGLQGIVIKSHGNADADSFANALRIAHLEIQNNVIEGIRTKLTQINQSKL